jgi:hypothetical protein
MTYLNVDRTGAPLSVPIMDRTVGGPGTAIVFDRSISDSGNHWGGTGDAATVCKGGSVGYLVKGVLDLRLEDFTTGTELQIWQVEMQSGQQVEKGQPHEDYAPTEHDDLPRGDPDHDPSVKHIRYPVFAYVNSGHTLQFRITQFHDSAEGWRIGVIAYAQCMLEINLK